jgi:hypothetical protein
LRIIFSFLFSCFSASAALEASNLRLLKSIPESNTVKTLFSGGKYCILGAGYGGRPLGGKGACGGVLE